MQSIELCFQLEMSSQSAYYLLGKGRYVLVALVCLLPGSVGLFV